tara:strand:- start:1320 stop:1439 length:120 start_codon:yes stop_codon:yes gene_type:complete
LHFLLPDAADQFGVNEYETGVAVCFAEGKKDALSLRPFS